MKPQTKKRIAWALMSGGFGAALLFAFVVLVKGDLPSAREWPIYVWPVGGLLLGIWGVFWSRGLYRNEPPVPPAAWTVQLTDLMLGMFFAGVFGLLSNLDPQFKSLAAFFIISGMVHYSRRSRGVADGCVSPVLARRVCT